MCMCVYVCVYVYVYVKYIRVCVKCVCVYVCLHVHEAQRLWMASCPRGASPKTGHTLCCSPRGMITGTVLLTC